MKTLSLIVIILSIAALALVQGQSPPTPTLAVTSTPSSWIYWLPLVRMAAPIFVMGAPPLPVCEIDDQPACATPTLAVPPTELPPTAYPAGG